MRILAGVVATVICVSAAWWSRLPVAADDPQKAEEEIHRAPGASAAGNPAVADPDKSGRLQITVVDAASQQPTFCRINVLGGDGGYYEPAQNPLSPWSLHRLGNRLGKGPFRYYGWFFNRAAHARSMFFPERCASKSGRGSNGRLSLKRLKSPLARLSPSN